MSSPPWAQNVQAAFQRDAALGARILDAAQRYPPEISTLLADIAAYVLLQSPPNGTATTGGDHNAKKRKLDDAPSQQQQQQQQPSAHPAVTNGAAQQHNASSASAAIANPVVAFECKDVSFQVPARKKLRLQIVEDGGGQTGAGAGQQQQQQRSEVRLLNSQTGATEFALAGGQIDEVFCLPVPEKQQRQWNFCVFPRAEAAAAAAAAASSSSAIPPPEQMVFTMAEAKPIGVHSASRAVGEEDTYITATEPELNRLLRPYGKRVVWPTEAEFASSIPQSHRKGEKAYHVKAHRGTKEGYLFFLPNGIVFGFKKPLSFFPFSSIESISYTSVLQRTFNLVITATEGGGTEVKETEFSMLDQADFAGIDEYIKKHGLNDASMAAERRAKAYNVNKDSKKGDNITGNAEAGGDDEDEQTELQKAEQQLQDEEDELEEDYEASGGESDGEGEDSDEDGDGEEYGEGYEEEYDEEEGDEEVEHEEDVHE